MDLVRNLKISLVLLIMFMLGTGGVYPLLVTGMAQLLFPWQANGSLISIGDKKIGSALIGQQFTAAKYFWGRPSATSPIPYNAQNSAGSNLSQSNPKYLQLVQARAEALIKSSIISANPNSAKMQIKNMQINYLVPVDLVTASASGLDPDISPKAAYYQMQRIAKARGMEVAKVQNIITESIKKRTFGILGEPRVNVLQLNLALDVSNGKS